MFASGSREYGVSLAIQILEGFGEEMVELVDHTNGHSAG